jgi:3',5'-nucleoside bisphosphate phosphatase
MIDLHAHSIFSDGSLTPEELVNAACEAGLTALALTDHDTVAGLPRFFEAARGRPIRPVPGVEISADIKKGTMHMLGYFMDPASESLNTQLQWIREGREKRNAEILEKLQKLGFSITWDEVKSYAGDDVVGRPHFAKALLAHGYARNWDDAFDRFLGKGKAAYAERQRFTPEDSIGLILQAKGVPVLAHPFTLDLAPDALRTLVGGLRDHGLQGLEVFYSEHSPELQGQYLKLTEEFGLVATGGSDFHGSMTPDIRLGRGFGSLRVPDEIVDQLLARRPE